jgi:phage terminase large subunit-like protein
VTANASALDLLGALVLEDDRLWGDVAEPWQWALAEWSLDPASSPSRWESRPRGGSKSTDIAGLEMVAMLAVLPSGSRSYAIAVDRDQGRLIIDAAAGFAMRTPALRNSVTIDNYKVTAGGSVFEVLAADAASAYGLKPARATCDEFCQWPNTVNAKGVWTAIHTAMGKVKHSKLLCASTSGDPGHWSHRIYQTARKSRSWTVQDTPGPLPWASEEFLAEQRAMLPESVFRRLHLNEWAAPEDRLTNVDDVAACVTLDGPLEHAPGHRYAIGVDLGITNDRTVCAVMHAERADNGEGRRVVQRVVLDRLEVWTPTRGNPVDLTAVEEWIALAARQYRAHVQIDPYQAVAMTQRLRNKGISIDEFTFSQASVGRLAMALHTTIRDHRLAIPNDPELIDELVNVRLRETSPNVYRLDHDTDRHDDRCIAMALAILKLTTTHPIGGPIILSDEEWEHRDLGLARALGQIAQPVKSMGKIGGAPDWSTGLERPDDEDQSLNGQTVRSPFV